MKRKVNPSKEIFNYCDRMVGAVQAGDLDDVKYLLDNNIRFAKLGEVKGKNGEVQLDGSVLAIALNNKDEEMISLLIEHGADINILGLTKEKQNLIISAIIHGSKENINRGFSTYAGFMSALGMAVYLNQVSDVINLLEAGADINHSNNCFELGGLLHVSVEHSNSKMTKLLLDYGVDLEFKNEKNQTAEEYARTRRANDEGFIKIFDDFREMKFIEAICSDDIKKVQILITQNQSLVHSKINQGKAEEMSVLEFVVGLGNFDITQLLLNNGADANQRLSNNDGFLLHLSARNKSSTIYDYLLNHGADQNQIDNAGKRAEEIISLEVEEIDQPVNWVDKHKRYRVSDEIEQQIKWANNNKKDRASEESCCVIM